MFRIYKDYTYFVNFITFVTYIGYYFIPAALAVGSRSEKGDPSILNANLGNPLVTIFSFQQPRLPRRRMNNGHCDVTPALMQPAVPPANCIDTVSLTSAEFPAN